MSRTDRTKSLWVRYTEHDPRPTHDHRHGTCDLPPEPTREDTGTRCRWEPGMLLFGGTRCGGCGTPSPPARTTDAVIRTAAERGKIGSAKGLHRTTVRR
jgi:hypothetical protein